MNAFPLLQQKNLHNLTSLWTLASTTAGQFNQEGSFSYCHIPGSQWPNRLWFTGTVTEQIIRQAATIVKQSPIPLTLSSWQDSLQNSFEQQGLIKRSEQTGMSLKPVKPFGLPGRLNLIRVITINQANDWAETFPLSFGYQISADTLIKTLEDIKYYLVYSDQQLAGTVIVHETGEVTGIHALSIRPEYRKRGFAEEVMAILINQAITANQQLITLQASVMGQSLYQKLGFTDDFQMLNYRIAAPL